MTTICQPKGTAMSKSKSKYGPNGERPSGKVMIHNHVRRYAAMSHGMNGFRRWFDYLDDPQIFARSHGKNAGPPPKYIVCKCGWRPDLGTHYRVKGMGTANYRCDSFEEIIQFHRQTIRHPRAQQ
jgi:hypothetical protein